MSQNVSGKLKKMPSQKRIASIAQSTAHHAVSGLCFVNPHLRRACIESGQTACSIDLLAENAWQPDFRHIELIRLSVIALRDKFVEIAKSEGFNPTDFREAVLRYEFPPFRDDYSSNCVVSITANSGYSVARAVDYLGNGAEVLTRNTEPGASPNGGPPERFGNSEVDGGRPSVS